jgi:hypothetical protein
MATRRHGLAAVAQVLRFFARRPGTRWAARAGFVTERVVSVDGQPWRVICTIHAVPAGPRRVEFQSSVTLWPRTLEKRPRWKRGGWNVALRKKKWYQACERRLGRHGYQGRWPASPWGRFGDFWKPLKDTAAVLAEVARLEQLGAEIPRRAGAAEQPAAAGRTRGPDARRPGGGADPRQAAPVRWFRGSKAVRAGRPGR